MRIVKIGLSAAVLAMLAACGGGGGGTVVDTTGEPIVLSRGPNPGNLTPSYDGGEDEVVASAGEVIIATYARSDIDDSGQISAYNAFTGELSDFAAFGESASGSSVYILNSTVDGFESIVAFVERVGTTEVPTEGELAYTGTYTGVFTEDLAGDPVYTTIIRGRAELTANLDDMMISGTISERRNTRSEVFYADVSLNETSISGGNFSGTTSGGSGVTSPFTTIAADGSYAGILAGPTGDEALGSLTFEHDPDGSTRTETGVFIAEVPSI